MNKTRLPLIVLQVLHQPVVVPVVVLIVEVENGKPD
jgi:hypothetical protein